MVRKGQSIYNKVIPRVLTYLEKVLYSEITPRKYKTIGDQRTDNLLLNVPKLLCIGAFRNRRASNLYLLVDRHLLIYKIFSILIQSF